MGYKKKFINKNHPAKYKRSKKHFQQGGLLSLQTYFLSKMSTTIKILMIVVSMTQILSTRTNHIETINRTKILIKEVAILMDKQKMNEMMMMKRKV